MLNRGSFVYKNNLQKQCREPRRYLLVVQDFSRDVGGCHAVGAGIQQPFDVGSLWGWRLQLEDMESTGL